jgi:flagellar biosynthesis chaperone FliJ
MIRLGGLVSQKAFGKFEMGKVISNPFANAFVNEAEGEDHEVSMGQNQLDTIIKMATELKAKMGENEKEIPAWIQDHISKAENYISQASGNYHEYGQNESVNEDNRFDLQLVKNMQQTIKDLETKLKMAKDSREKEMIKKNIAVNVDLMKYWAQRSRN